MKEFYTKLLPPPNAFGGYPAWVVKTPNDTIICLCVEAHGKTAEENAEWVADLLNGWMKYNE